MFSGLGDKLKGLVYNDVPESTQSPATPTSGTVGAAPASIGSLAQTVNVEMVAAIRKATFNRNTAFTQLLAASDALADVIPDQTMRLKAAHKTGGAGRTGRQIADAVDVHLQDVDGEELRFKTMIDQKISSEVGALEQQANLATQQSQQAAAEIQQAQERIAALNKLILELGAKANEANAAVNAKRAEFDQASGQFKLAAQAVRAELQGSKSAILSTLV